MSKTERSKVNFIVKESQNDRWMVEVYLYDGIDSIKPGILFLECREGTTMDEAREIGRFLKERFSHVSFLSDVEPYCHPA